MSVDQEAKIIELPSDDEEATKENVDIQEGSDSDSEGVPELEEGQAGDGPQVQAANKQSRSEKKARKVIGKLGLKPVTGVTRVAIRKSKQMLFVINKPEVFKNATSDTYVVFGEAKIEDMNSSAQAQMAAAKRMEDRQKQAAQQAAAAATDLSTNDTGALVEDEIDDDEEDIDKLAAEHGIEDKDIELVVNQASCSRQKAIKALAKHDKDIVNAIMALTV